MKDWSDYTLISFGDSFTFGQDTVAPRKRNTDLSAADWLEANRTGTTLSYGDQATWKKECNKLSYSQVIADKMGFKDVINFGVMGGSNDRSLQLIEMFLRRNPTMKVFVLFNFTSTSRYQQFLKVSNEEEYHSVDFNFNFDTTKCVYDGINEESIGNQYTYWKNQIQDVYNHVKDRRSLYYMLSTYKVPYVSFDIMNYTDTLMLRDNPINYIKGYGKDGVLINLMYNDEEYDFREFDYIQSYYDELVNDTPLLSHMTVRNGPQTKYMKNCILGEEYFEPGGHWNANGHIEYAKLVEKYINENYN